MHYFLLINIVLFTLPHYSEGLEVAKEVEGGVQLLTTGSVELVVPETLSFTFLKNPFVGDFKICYASTPSVNHKKLYVNVGISCPPDYCTIMLVSNGMQFALSKEKQGDRIHAWFNEDAELMCPRHVVNNRQSFTIIELPNCPVIVDGASLPKDKEVETNNNASVTWIIITAVGLCILLLMVIIIGLCICLRFKKNAVPAAPSSRPVERISKSPMSPAPRTFPSNSE